MSKEKEINIDSLAEKFKGNDKVKVNKETGDVTLTFSFTAIEQKSYAVKMLKRIEQDSKETKSRKEKATLLLKELSKSPIIEAYQGKEKGTIQASFDSKEKLSKSEKIEAIKRLILILRFIKYKEDIEVNDSKYLISSHLNEHYTNSKKKAKEVVSKKEIEYNVKFETPKEYKVLDALCMALYDNSNKDTKDESYMKGNAIELLGKKQIKDGYAMLRVNPQKLYKAVTGKDVVNNKEIKAIKKALASLHTKQHPIRQSFTSRGKEKDIIRFVPLIEIALITNKGEIQAVENIEEALFTDIKKGELELVIEFNPIFTKDLQKKYISIPRDLTDDLERYIKPRRITVHHYRFRSMIYQFKSSKRNGNKLSIIEANLDKKIGIDKISHSTKRREKREKIIQDFKGVGVIEEATTYQNKKGETVYNFLLESPSKEEV